MQEIKNNADSPDTSGLDLSKGNETEQQNEVNFKETENYWSENLGETKNPEEKIEAAPLSSYEERMAHVPKENSERGAWSGERGESGYRPSSPEVLESMEKRGVSEIPYQDAKVNFSEVAEATVEIDNMTDRRLGAGGNFEQCDTRLAENWNNEQREGRSDWTARDVDDFRHENRYSWHERNDMKTCDLVPTDIHEACTHLGGVSECKRLKAGMESVFDE